MRLFVLPLAVGDPEDIASPVPLGFQGDGFSWELHENTAASQPPNENHMLEPDTRRPRGLLLHLGLAVGAAGSPGRVRRKWTVGVAAVWPRGHCRALVEPRAGAPKASSVCVFLSRGY